MKCGDLWGTSCEVWGPMQWGNVVKFRTMGPGSVVKCGELWGSVVKCGDLWGGVVKFRIYGLVL